MHRTLSGPPSHAALYASFSHCLRCSCLVCCIGIDNAQTAADGLVRSIASYTCFLLSEAEAVINDVLLGTINLLYIKLHIAFVYHNLMTQSHSQLLSDYMATRMPAQRSSYDHLA